MAPPTQSLRDWRVNLGWSIKRLAEEAAVSYPSVRAAERGQRIKAETAKAIADALSKAYGQGIKVTDISGLIIQ